MALSLKRNLVLPITIMLAVRQGHPLHLRPVDACPRIRSQVLDNMPAALSSDYRVASATSGSLNTAISAVSLRPSRVLFLKRVYSLPSLRPTKRISQAFFVTSSMKPMNNPMAPPVKQNYEPDNCGSKCNRPTDIDPGEYFKNESADPSA